MKPREEMIEAVLEAPVLLRTIERLAMAGEGDIETLRDRAKSCLSSIATDYNDRWVGVWEKVLSVLWRAMYDGFVVDHEGMAKIREISRRMPIVIVPCHRSHLDYLIISYLFFKEGIPLPCVAAGDNMNFWPLGYFFRQSGAFFMRRSFQGDEIYAAAFASYVEELLKEGMPVEFFVEGGRSRTGKMLLPKYGMISMIVRAYQDNAVDDLALIPVSVGYDRIVEENSYLKELNGLPKRSESLLDVIKHTKIMMHRYGRAYINIGDPLFLKSYFAAQRNSFAVMTGDDKQALYRDMGVRLTSEINRVSVVTPFALTAASLICRGEKNILGESLRQTFTAFYDYLRHRGANFAPSFSLWEDALPQALKLIEERGFILPSRRDEIIDVTLYFIPEMKRLNLEYYKNNIVHHFLSVGLVALSIISRREEGVTAEQIRADCLFLKNLFRREFIFGEYGDGEIDGAMSYLEEKGVIEYREGKIAVGQKGMDELASFAGLFRSYAETYWVALHAFCSGKVAAVEDLHNRMRHVAEEMYGTGDILRIESISQENYKNAVRFLGEEGALNFSAENKHGADPFIDGAAVETLRLRLSNFMEEAKSHKKSRFYGPINS